ncbi:MAG: hypothetical protein ACXVXP_00540 [Mycobacteriaceae bacterium]
MSLSDAAEALALAKGQLVKVEAVTYSPTESYSPGTVVDFRGTVYVAARDVPAGYAFAPTNTSYWTSAAGQVGNVSGGLVVQTINPVQASQALTLPSSAGGAFEVTLTQNSVLSIAGASSSVECNVDVVLTQDASGGRTVTWPGSITWLPGSAPTLPVGPGQAMLISLTSLDGGASWYGYYNSGQGAFPSWPGPWFNSSPYGGQNATLMTANLVYAAALVIPGKVTLTGLLAPNGNTGVGNLLPSLYDSNGNQIAVGNSVAQASGFAMQHLPFTAPVQLQGGIYYGGIQSNNASTKLTMGYQGMPAAGFAQGSFAAPASISPVPAASTAGQSVQPAILTY